MGKKGPSQGWGMPECLMRDDNDRDSWDVRITCLSLGKEGGRKTLSFIYVVHWLVETLEWSFKDRE